MPENGVPRDFDPTAKYFQLDERVTNLRSSVSHLESQMQSGFSSLNAQLTALSDHFRQGQKTQWPVIWSAAGVMFTVLAGIGAILYMPITRDLARLQEQAVTRTEWDSNNSRSAETRMRFEDAIAKVAESSVPRSELTILAQNYRDDQNQVHEQLTTMTANKVDRNEWMERNRARDTELADVSRRINELQAGAAATYNLRDVIVDLKEQVRTLELARLAQSAAAAAAPRPAPLN